MVIHGDFYPVNEVHLPEWHRNFARVFAEWAEELGFSPDDVEAAQTRCDMVNYVVTHYKPEIELAKLLAFEIAAQVLGNGGNLTSERQLHPFPEQKAPPVWVFGIEKSTRQLVARIKASTGYSEIIGHEMQVIGPRHHHELSAPMLQIRALEGRKIEVRWSKRGASGLELLVDYGAGFPAEGRLFTPAKFETILPGEGAQTVAIKGFYVVKNARVGAEGPMFEVTLRA